VIGTNAPRFRSSMLQTVPLPFSPGSRPTTIGIPTRLSPLKPWNLSEHAGSLPDFKRSDNPAENVQKEVNCIEVLLDIEKKSPDRPLPLKSALGGVNALIKHYQVRLFHTTFTCY